MNIKSFLMAVVLSSFLTSVAGAQTPVPCDPNAPDGTGISQKASDAFGGTICRQPITSMVNHLSNSGALNIQGPSLSMSEAYVALGKQPDGATKQKAFIHDIFDSLSKLVGSPTTQDLVKSQLGVNLPPATPASIDFMTQRAFESMKDPSNRKNLDTFPTLTRDQLVKIQQDLANSGAYNSVDSSVVTAFPTKDLGATSINSSGCTPEQFTPQPVFSNVDAVVRGGVPVTESMSPCVAQNSAALASLFNQLSNTASRSPLSAPLRLVQDGQTNATQLVRSNSELLAALGKMGYTVETSTTTSKVDFLGPSLKNTDGTYTQIKDPSFVVDANGVRKPAYHGELNLLLIKDGKVSAKLSWFMGAPTSASEKGVSVMWRPQTSKRAAWNEQKIENKRQYLPSQTQKALPWLEATGDLMRGFRQVSLTLNPSINGYGLFICGDSLAMLLEKLSHNSSDPCYSNLTTHVFPIMRAGNIQIQKAGKSIDLTQMVIDQAGGIDRTSLNTDYPSDL